MPKSPLATVTERFKDKAALIDAVKALATDDLWIDRVNEDKGLPRISNRKLLHLHDVLSQVKKDHGSRSKLIDALLESEKRSKDAGYRTHLEKLSTPALMAQLNVSKKRNLPKKEAKPKPKAEAAPKATAPKKKAAKAAKKAAPKAAAKKPAAKKAASKRKKSG
jgi:hypothetical protein